MSAAETIVPRFKFSDTCILWTAIGIYALVTILIFGCAILMMGPYVLILSPPYLLLYFAGIAIFPPRIEKVLRCGGGSGGDGG